jgi:hypothetical protein
MRKGDERSVAMTSGVSFSEQALIRLFTNLSTIVWPSCQRETFHPWLIACSILVTAFQAKAWPLTRLFRRSPSSRRGSTLGFESAIQNLSRRPADRNPAQIVPRILIRLVSKQVNHFIDDPSPSDVLGAVLNRVGHRLRHD